jgi:hypothetical protein
MLILENDLVSGAKLAKERLKRHEMAEIIPYVQNELKTRTAMGGALSNPGRALVLKALNVSMGAWESIDIGMTGDSRTVKTAI